MRKLLTIAAILLCLCSCNSQLKNEIPDGKLYLYTLSATSPEDAYDEAEAVACIQGIVNRNAPVLYVLSSTNTRPAYWLDKFYDGWMKSPQKIQIETLDDLFEWAQDKIKGLVIWDENVPASFNVATTIAGIEDAVVVTSEMAVKLQDRFKVIADLRGLFDGTVTGSAKNDAYIWAKEEYLDKGKCSSHLMCLYEDPVRARSVGDLSYVVTRDWAVCNRAFVYDLSPWGDERPSDDMTQPIGCDLNTYKQILSSKMKFSADKEMTEVAGFFSFWKYSNQPGYPGKHGDVETEWENVFVISQYNCYQNTVASNCFNQSFHSKAPSKAMTQGRPENYIKPENGKTYICLFMADYDSTTPLYDFMPGNWEDPRRGERPLLWGINPNLCETYPDIFEWLYSTRAEGDYFSSDASCAGYFNPNQLPEESLPLFVEHNKKFFEQWDMSLAPMVLDTDAPTDAVKDAFTQFSPDGFAEIVIDFHNTGGKVPPTHIWKGMPVTELLNGVCNEGGNFTTVENEAQRFASRLGAADPDSPQFYLIRIVWQKPSTMFDVIDRVKTLRPDLDIELLDGYNYFNCLKQANYPEL